MKASEVISAKIQTLLGSNYHIFSNTYFNKNYTEAREVREGENIGYARYTTAEYGKFRKDKVVGIFTMTNPSRANSGIYYLSGGYKIEFSVPRNVVNKTKYDEVISQPAYNFDTDIENLIDTITNANIQYTVAVGNTTKTYNGRLTMSEPNYLMTESDGEYQYDIMTVSGNFIISDKAKFGSQYKVAFGINNSYVELDDISSFTESINNDGNAIVKENKTRIEQNLGQSGWVCTISIDDYETTNLARQKIYSIIHENKEIINSSATNNSLKRKQRVKITTPHGHTHIFNAIMTISFTATENGVGAYAISFTEDNKDALAHTLSFNTSGGNQVQPKGVREGVAIGELPTPVKSGYTFQKWQIDGVDITPTTKYNFMEDKEAVAIYLEYAEVWTFNEEPSEFTDKTFNESYYYYYMGEKLQCTSIQFTTYDGGGQDAIFFNSASHTGGYIAEQGQGWIDGNTTAHRTLYFANSIDTTGDENTLGYWLTRNATKVD